MHGANTKIIFITFTLFKTSRHACSKCVRNTAWRKRKQT